MGSWARVVMLLIAIAAVGCSGVDDREPQQTTIDEAVSQTIEAKAPTTSEIGLPSHLLILELTAEFKAVILEAELSLGIRRSREGLRQEASGQEGFELGR